MGQPSSTSALALQPEEPARLQLDTFIPYRLSNLTNAYTLGVTRLLRNHYGLGIREWRVLAHLHAAGPLSVTELAERTLMEKGRVSRAVSSLVHDGYVFRQATSGSARSFQVALTDQATKLLKDLIPLMQSRAEALLSALDAPERESLLTILNKLQHRVWQINAGIEI